MVWHWISPSIIHYTLSRVLRALAISSRFHTVFREQQRAQSFVFHHFNPHPMYC